MQVLERFYYNSELWARHIRRTVPPYQKTLRAIRANRWRTCTHPHMTDERLTRLERIEVLVVVNKLTRLERIEVLVVVNKHHQWRKQRIAEGKNPDPTTLETLIESVRASRKFMRETIGQQINAMVAEEDAKWLR